MTERLSHSLRLVSVLLQYPDEALLGRLEELATIAGDVCLEAFRPAVLTFIVELGQMVPLQIQERYTALFDLDPTTTLNVTYQMYGDNEKRAAVLAQLQHCYEQAGWERMTGELPDYLPMMLEFLSICSHSEHTGPAWQCLQRIQPLVDGLARRAPAYATLLQPIVRIADQHLTSIEKGDVTFATPV